MHRLIFLLPVLVFLPLVPVAGALDGAAIYQQSCSMCHGLEGQGVSGVFPPLAKSDFLQKHRERALRAPMEGLSGEIEVNGRVYHGSMPPAILDDVQLVALFNHVFSSWGNSVSHTTKDEISDLRRASSYPTFEHLKKAMLGKELPEPPNGWSLSVGAELSFSPTRLTVHPDREQVLALSPNGDVWKWNARTSEKAEILIPADGFIPKGTSDEGAMGMTVDTKGRLYIVCNKRDDSATPVQSRITIYRTAPWKAGSTWGMPKPWFQTTTPYGIGGYNHGVSHIAEGPDGMLYINSGARTDSGEGGTDPKYSTAGESPNTAGIWRMNPNEEVPHSFEIFARGLRNSYGFCWDDERRMVGTDNGPNAHAPEELNLIKRGEHYGFPFRHSDVETRFYSHQPAIPRGLVISPPLRNLGPHGGGNEAGLATFEPHSCPTGIVWLDRTWPSPFGGCFLTTRFGNMIQLDADVGYDVLQLHVDFDAGTVVTKRLLYPLGRPVDLVKLAGHRIVIAEYSLATSSTAGLGTPGRLLVLQQSK